VDYTVIGQVNRRRIYDIEDLQMVEPETESGLDRRGVGCLLWRVAPQTDLICSCLRLNVELLFQPKEASL
jgi:hypothetical protein